MFTHSRNHTLLRDFMAAGDTIVLLVSILAASFLTFNPIILPDLLVVQLLALPTFYLTGMLVFSGYHLINPSLFQMGLRPVIIIFSASLTLVLAWLTVTPEVLRVSLPWFAYFSVAGLSFLVVLRLCVFGILYLLKKQGSFHPTAAIICSGSISVGISQLEDQARENGYRIICRCVVENDDEAKSLWQEWLGSLRQCKPNQIVIALSKEHKSMFAIELSDLEAIYAEAQESEQAFADSTNGRNLNQADSVPGNKENVPPPIFVWRAVRPFGRRGWWIKRIEDILLGSIAIIITAPVMLVVGILVKTSSPGPMFYSQRRHGFNGEEFRILKFRSMYADQCEKDDSPITRQATRQDARITPVGTFIRKTSLDELPQLFNVILGDMSLVGPRPHSPHHNALYRLRISGYFSRHCVRPGMTGWAQINGWRGETNTDEKMRQRVLHDLFYIRHWSLGLDIRILFLTAVQIFNDKKAY